MAVCPTALHPVLDLASLAQLPQKARAPECQKYWWGQGNLVGIICLPNWNSVQYVRICQNLCGPHVPIRSGDSKGLNLADALTLFQFGG